MKHDNPLLAPLTLNNRDETCDKLTRFRKASPNKLNYLFDFDRTLTTTAHIGKDITVWHLLDSLLPDEEHKKHRRLSSQYQAMELAGELTEDHALAWWTLSFEMYIQQGMNISQIRKVLGELKIREGAIELFALCESAGIPRVILSAGIGDVIEVITEEHGMRATSILSTKLRFAEDGRMIGWDPDSLVHILNKPEKGRSKLKSIQRERPFTVLFGDSVEDARMVKGSENVLRVRVGDWHWGDKSNWDEYVQSSFDNGFDIVVKQEDLKPLVDLTRWLIG
jgi:HAD superfamily phosphoserine phosphatase-like hydrolase